MKIGSRLSKEQKQQLNKMSKPKQEKVNWKEIMGTNNKGLRRKKGGAWH